MKKITSIVETVLLRSSNLKDILVNYSDITFFEPYPDSCILHFKSGKKIRFLNKLDRHQKIEIDYELLKKQKIDLKSIRKLFYND